MTDGKTALQLTEYRRHCLGLAGALALLFAGLVCLNVVVDVSAGWSLKMTAPTFYFCTLLMIALPWCIVVRTAFCGGWPDSGIEWLWSIGVLFGFAALIHCWIIPVPVYFSVQMLLGTSALLIILVACAVWRSRIPCAVGGLILGILLMGKWHVLSRICLAGEYRFIDRQGAGYDIEALYWWPLRAINNLMSNALPSVKLSDFRLDGYELHSTRTEIVQTLGAVFIFMSILLGDWLVGKIRSFRTNAYFESMREQSGTDFRFLFDAADVAAYSRLPIEQHHEHTIACFRRLYERLQEQHHALQAMDPERIKSLSGQFGPSVQCLISMKDDHSDSGS